MPPLSRPKKDRWFLHARPRCSGVQHFVLEFLRELCHSLRMSSFPRFLKANQA